MPKPLHPELRRTIEARALAGIRPGEIAIELAGRVPLATIYSVIHKARRGGADIGLFARGRPARIGLATVQISIDDEELVRRLDRAARARRRSRQQILDALIAAVLGDDLIDAVLDDEMAIRTGAIP